MKVAVWDTYVKREDGKIMHFDVLVPSDIKDENIVFEYAKQYLQKKSFKTNQLSSNECQFCHIEQATQEMLTSIKTSGYSIIEMENCN